MTSLDEARCECCHVNPLALACEMLVLRALEVLGRRIIRNDRRGKGRAARGDTPWHSLHLIYEASARDIDGALRHAWEMVDDIQERWGNGRYDPLLSSKLERYTRELIDHKKTPTIDGVTAALDPVAFELAPEPRPQIPRGECVECGKRASDLVK